MNFVNRSLTFFAVIILSITIIGFFLVRRLPPAAPTVNNLTVAATIFPLADIVRHVGGNLVNVLQIIPPNVSEHSNTLTPEQLRQLQKTRLIFQIGHNLDTALTERITHVLPDIPLITVDRGIVLHDFVIDDEDHRDTGIDPHYWLTIPNAQLIATSVADELSLIDPAHESDYQTNLISYKSQLDTLERELQQQAATAPAKNFMAMHNAWSYLADQYGFKLVATYEPLEGREPSLADLNHLRNSISQFNIHTFYTEPQKNSTSTTRFLEDEFNLKIRILDPVGGLPPYDSYENLMRVNMRALTN